MEVKKSSEKPTTYLGWLAGMLLLFGAVYLLGWAVFSFAEWQLLNPLATRASRATLGGFVAVAIVLSFCAWVDQD